MSIVSDWYDLMANLYGLDIKALIQTTSLCDKDMPHTAHVFTEAVYPTHASGWNCPGQYVRCRYCNDETLDSCVICGPVGLDNIKSIETVDNSYRDGSHHSVVIFNCVVTDNYGERRSGNIWCSCGEIWDGR